ncbi:MULTISPECIES: hypothetical protein [unclassified Spiroplasma]|uniref:hypothetical protein n=1 Tax=unclassified Spiroplasma TaxID=2637901 RepID=UPI0030D6164C
MSDTVKNTVKNVIYQFSIKGSDFENLSMLALPIKNWIDENGQEFADFIMRHRNLWNATNYENIHLKDMPSAMDKVDILFREPLQLIKNFKDELNRIRTNIITFENYLQNHKIEIKNNMTQARIQKQK